MNNEERPGMAKVRAIYEDGVKEAVDLIRNKSYVDQRRAARAAREEKKREAEEATVATVSQDTFDDVFASFGSALKKKYATGVKHHTQAVAHVVPFIDPVFDSYFKLTPGQLVTIAAYTGDGKSTNAANVAASAVEAGKRVMVFSNEEKSTDFFDMVACIVEGIYHKDYIDRTMHPDDQRKVMQRVGKFIKDKSFICLDEEDTGGGTTKDDYILNCLQALTVAKVKPDVVIIDYLTNIYAVGSTSSDNHYFELSRFLGNLKNLINKLSFPLVVCAQMHSDDKKKGSKGKPAALDTRLIMGGDVLRCSTVAVEVKPDFLTKVSTITIHKNRTYKEKGVIQLKFDKGRLTNLKIEDLVGTEAEKQE